MNEEDIEEINMQGFSENERKGLLRKVIHFLDSASELEQVS